MPIKGLQVTVSERPTSPRYAPPAIPNMERPSPRSDKGKNDEVKVDKRKGRKEQSPRLGSPRYVQAVAPSMKSPRERSPRPQLNATALRGSPVLCKKPL